MKVLIADDQVHACQLLAGLLRRWGYETVAVHDGLSALEGLRDDGGPRLALLDWLMPGLDGIEVCRRLRQDVHRPYPYLILVTGQGGRQQMLEGLEAGADDFLAKPVDEAELRARLAAGRRVVTLQEQLRNLATRDPLTGLWNRAAILDLMAHELSRARREGSPVGVLLADVDHFKRVNDTLGHLAGDHVLRQASRRMLASLRPYDLMGRFGGEEFLILLPGCDGATALRLAGRLCEAVAAEPFAWEGERVDVTLSLGVSAWPEGERADAVALLRAADLALYEAKRGGRNRAALAAGPAPLASRQPPEPL